MLHSINIYLIFQPENSQNIILWTSEFVFVQFFCTLKPTQNTTSTGVTHLWRHTSLYFLYVEASKLLMLSASIDFPLPSSLLRYETTGLDQESTCWEETINSCNLSSALHMPTVTRERGQPDGSTV